MSIGKEFDLTDACALVAEQTPGYADADIREILDLFFKVTAKALAEHSRVEYKDFGVLRLKMQSAKSGIDPQGEPWHTPERLKIVYRPWPEVKQTIAEKTGIPVV